MVLNTKGLFPITQAAKACGLSRSTLMRMEERGLITPAYISPKSGRRYYDIFNIGLILQIQQFQTMGFGADETAAYYAKGGNAEELLSTLEEKLNLLQRSVEELRLRAMKESNMSVQILKIPETVCCVRRCAGLTIQEKYDVMAGFYCECVEKGYELTAEPLFVINERTDYLEGKISKEPYPNQFCVPVNPKHAPADAVRFPSCTVLSVLYYGDYSDVDEAWLALGREAKARALVPADFPRAVGIVAPVTGRAIEQNRYCTRIVMPVEV